MNIEINYEYNNREEFKKALSFCSKNINRIIERNGTIFVYVNNNIEEVRNKVNQLVERYKKDNIEIDTTNEYNSGYNKKSFFEMSKLHITLFLRCSFYMQSYLIKITINYFFAQWPNYIK